MKYFIGYSPTSKTNYTQPSSYQEKYLKKLNVQQGNDSNSLNTKSSQQISHIEFPIGKIWIEIFFFGLINLLIN